jgi:hypothetical protein
MYSYIITTFVRKGLGCVCGGVGGGGQCPPPSPWLYLCGLCKDHVFHLLSSTALACINEIENITLASHHHLGGAITHPSPSRSYSLRPSSQGIIFENLGPR